MHENLRLLHSQERLLSDRLERVATQADRFICNRFIQGVTCVGLGESHGNTYLHKQTAELMRPLSKVGVDVVCLEIDTIIQNHLDRYFKSKKEEDLQPVINYEQKMVDCGYPVGGRLATTDYFDIIRNATKHGIRVMAIDDVNLALNERDSLMASNIPKHGKTFVYAGQVHLTGKQMWFGGIPRHLQRQGKDIYTIRQITASEGADPDMSRLGISKRFFEVVGRSSILKSMGRFGFGISHDPTTRDCLKKIFPKKNPEYFGDAFIYSQDIRQN